MVIKKQPFNGTLSNCCLYTTVQMCARALVLAPSTHAHVKIACRTKQATQRKFLRNVH